MRDRTTIRVALLDHLIRADADLLEGFRGAVALQIGQSPKRATKTMARSRV
jgi:hypothetical protein